MPNLCDYDMRVEGKKDDIEKLHRIMKFKDEVHMYRIFSADVYDLEKKNEDIYVASICGDCAWSVYVCMLEGPFCYYQGEQEGTSLLQLSKALNLKIEVYSSESGFGFQEHYYIERGELKVNEEKDYGEFWFDEDDLSKEAIEKEINGPITDKEYKDYLAEGYFSRGGYDKGFQYV